MLWWKEVSPGHKLAVVVIHRMPVQGRCAIPCAVSARCCHDSQNAWWKKGVLSRAAMQARCCHDQNALVEEGVYPCAHAQALLLL
jgi:hypothetical protein